MKNDHYSLSDPERIYSRFLVLVVAMGLTGCGAPSIYHWGRFEDGLHDRYVSQNHPQADAYLLETITKAEQENLRIPPGAYADYGFLLFKRGDREGAIAYFEKEKRIFPESDAFMTKLIERIKQKESDSAEKHQPQAAIIHGTQP
ncbi:hypothetical protein SAMN05216428_10755 [Nitrosospira sp. Nsp11]|uniref:DUF4810 domain-containing protein n=1 Tax=Nitrosospira sp. Nsp11 TaxID=1855338 RepID=UPI000921AE58|nr:DUF4810 domain-containing protein [Nitrosospira sp. Nsp11]SHL84227.1 hypothetical protein SAMN05216428_10755 [Nitrosospira sp. Nsp11]